MVEEAETVTLEESEKAVLVEGENFFPNPGVENETVVNAANGDDGSAVSEKVVYDYDEGGNLVGSHKEIA